MRLVGQKTVYSGWSRFLLLEVILGDGQQVLRQLEDHGEASAVLPYDAQRRTALLVRQPRVGPLFSGFDPNLVEAAAGIIDHDEGPDGAAIREAFEELGVRLGVLEPLTAAWSMPAVCTERIHMFLAPYTLEDRVADGGGMEEEGEEIEVLEAPLSALLAQADSGELIDMKTLVMVLTLARRRPDLFA